MRHLVAQCRPAVGGITIIDCGTVAFSATRVDTVGAPIGRLRVRLEAWVVLDCRCDGWVWVAAAVLAHLVAVDLLGVAVASVDDSAAINHSRGIALRCDKATLPTPHRLHHVNIVVNDHHLGPDNVLHTVAGLVVPFSSDDTLATVDEAWLCHRIAILLCHVTPMPLLPHQQNAVGRKPDALRFADGEPLLLEVSEPIDAAV
mmetsp:Transcript_78177/g.207570  ORF Transcript_78177/g.207570 Transcript_78177/m.207570 type:complete len:202 (-) Transcript_78177:206-811(-)